MIYQKDIVSAERVENNGRINKREFAIVSRDEYNTLTSCYIGCKIEYTDKKGPFLVPISGKGIRGNGKVNVLDIEVIDARELDCSISKISELSIKEFMKIIQITLLIFKGIKL